MSVFLKGFLCFLAFTLFARWYFVCQIKHECRDAPAAVTRTLTLQLWDGKQMLLDGFEPFTFPLHSYAPEWSSDNHTFIRETARLLQQQPDKKIEITGRYGKDENNAPSGIFENIGIARAWSVKQELAKAGIDENRIFIAHDQVPDEIPHLPVSFHLFLPSTDPYAKLAYTFTDNTFSDINFEFNSAIFKPLDPFILYADSVRVFLNEHPDYKMIITGHTDNKGMKDYNYNFGLERSQAVAQYFRALGIQSEIEIMSKGNSQPVAPNTRLDGKDNTKGRQMNRRVHIKLLKKELQ